jgi:predicted Co/Zn/Cd cation transporter (cation efflux family)
MDPRPLAPRRRGLTGIDGALALAAVLLIVQMWLLTATLEAYLAGHRETALPAAIISGLLFLGCLALYVFIMRLDRRVRSVTAPSGRSGPRPIP